MHSEIQNEISRSHLYFSVPAAGAALTLGVVVATGWATHNATLITIFPGFPAMVFNTALCFILCGAALLFYCVRWRFAAAACAFATLAIGALVSAQYATGIDLNIDEPLFPDFVRINHPYPGRMAIFTGIGFIMAGAALGILARSQNSERRTLYAEILGALVTAAGFIPFMGYLTGLDLYVGKIAWNSMALHTAFGFIILGSAILVESWAARTRPLSTIHPAIAPVLGIAAAALDVYTPLGIASGIAYMPLVFSAIWFRDVRTSFLFALFGSVLTILGFFISPSPVTAMWIVFVNRAISIFSIWVLALLVYLVKRGQTLISATEHRLNAILDNTVDGLISIDDKGHIETFNKACEAIFGYQAVEVIGENVKILMPEPYHAEHDGYLKNYRETGKRKVIGIGREVKGRRKDGSVFPIDLSVSEVNVDGRKIYSGIVRDISDRKKAEEELIRSNEELERFAYIASHDLQEPLRMVANFTGLLESEYQDKFDKQASQYMRFIIDATQRMQNLVGDLLEYSRVGSEDAGFFDFSCASHTQLALANLQEIIEETRAVISIGDLPVVHANPVRFTRLMQNLIGNGIKYRRTNQRPQITVKADDRGDEWLFSVSDNGIGIRKEYLDQIFIIFKRLHNKREYKGTGIGLAVCKKIVESFDGKIWAESTPGSGSTFHFTIPKKETGRKAA